MSFPRLKFLVLSQIEIVGSNGGFEEERESGEVRVEPMLGHEVKDGDCLMTVAQVGLMSQTAVEVVKGGKFD